MSMSEWSPRCADFEMVFEYKGKKMADGRWTSLESKVRVEDLLAGDKDLLTFFCIIINWESLHWHRFSNMMTLCQYSPEYWRQLDMNRMVYSKTTCIDDLKRESDGYHFGDCISVPTSCSRCNAESSYLMTLHYMREFANEGQWTTETMGAMLVARDEVRLNEEDNYRREITPVDAAAEAHRDNHLMEWYTAAKAKYPGEYYIDVKKYIDNWASLPDDQKGIYLERVRQIRKWCDEEPKCPGVPWR